jgi:molybdopterin converting factor small subunit
LVVTVHLHTTLQRQTPEGLQRLLRLPLPSGSTLGDLLDCLAIPRTDESILLVVNGRMADSEQLLQHDDEVHVIPALAGGAPRRAPGHSR